MSDLVPASTAHKHKCSPLEACSIHLSDIGRHFHTFLTGTFHARFGPPALPPFVLRYCTTHPLQWQWTTKTGPNAGKTFKVPTAPSHCPEGSPKAILWLVNVFHSFKAHLAPETLQGGKVPRSLLHLYQSNMVLHLRTQLCAHTPTNTPPALAVPRPHHSTTDISTQTPSPAEAVLCSPSTFPPVTTFESADSELHMVWRLYATTLAWVAALEVELAGLRPTPQASANCPSPQAAPSPNPFTITAGFVPAATQPMCT
ncbi:hypothetical protein HYDPIDRAFT_29067 [Hydnomerulius pinastri MD-312]|uniref:Uncharacterized protein n=1 Tax=Hydnomerulius pinastri MD-312 TaxID=994086 RepID=A0A0C9W8E7_9AGAM|nr:hypothetical protein HYDPIDRAFT_29067 [Hydnomerulius pinastri MD-312]